MQLVAVAYHLDSQGNKFETEWDCYNADAELDLFEKKERGGTVATVESTKPAHKTPHNTKSKALAFIQGIEHEFEAVLSFLDTIRGDDEVKQLRKAIADKVTKDFARIDAGIDLGEYSRTLMKSAKRTVSAADKVPTPLQVLKVAHRHVRVCTKKNNGRTNI
ncbi:hypothetical protein PsorP6_002220 [Peronosclerospora sorghi]|uniref:Uncharacterized protein n=1 Tax=Peronosclerospora sorghi TaxID=230839 RepID=A0ACC0WVF5_9STRA|nr:hypothetical protein PsorP6_002220 [Peronosclerospora sorghi]